MSREHGELLTHILGAAVRTIGVVTVPDELLEMRLAFHADVLIDRHRRESLGRAPDAPQMRAKPARVLGGRPGVR